LPPTFTPLPSPSPTASATPAPSPTPQPPPTEATTKTPEQEQTPLEHFFNEIGIAFEEEAWAQVKFSDGTLIRLDTLANTQEILRRIRENGGLIDTAGGGGGVAFKHKDGTVVHRTAYHSDAHNAEGIFVKYENGKYLVIGPDNRVLNDEAMTDVFYFFRGGVPDDFSSKVEELILRKMGAGAALDQPRAMMFTREELGFGPKPIPRADALASRRAHQAELERNRPQIKQPLAQRTIGGGFRAKV
jgi:hypothetical protein